MSARQAISSWKQKISSMLRNEFPFLIFFMVFINNFFFSMVQTMIFSFLPKLVKFFGVDEVDVGRSAGIIASAIFIGGVLSSILWGYVTDKYSKKFTMVFCQTGTLLTTIAFGFSRNVSYATITRCLQGFASGQLVVLKGVLGETCNENTMAYGMAVLMTAYALGNTIGPSVGGWTAFPADVYPSTFSKDGIFGQFPALLPHVIAAVGLAVGVIVSLFFFPNPRKHDEEKTPLLPKKEPKNNRNFLESIKTSALYEVICVKELHSCCVLYFFFSVTDVGFNEMYPVLAATAPRYKGLGWTPTQLGTVIMIVFMACILFQLTYLPKLNNYLGPKRYLILANLILIFVQPLLPMIAGIRNPTVQWLTMILIIFLDRCCIFAGYLAINVITNNSVEEHQMGMANGIAMTAANGGRLFSPVMCGSIYSWSLTNIKGVEGNVNALGFPFNQFCMFYFLALVSIVIAVMTSQLPDSMDQKKMRRHSSRLLSLSASVPLVD